MVCGGGGAWKILSAGGGYSSGVSVFSKPMVATGAGMGAGSTLLGSGLGWGLGWGRSGTVNQQSYDVRITIHKT